MLFTYSYLLEQYQNYVNPKSKIQRLVKENKLIKIGKGLYESNNDIDPFYLANAIYSPSYISFETVLSMYQLIPERVEKITCASFRKNKKKTYQTPFGTYTYEDIKDAAFPYGTNLIEENGYTYMIATKEKAICDLLSKKSPVSNKKEMKNLLFEDLRINEELFYQLDLNIIKELEPLYKSTNVTFLTKILTRREDNYKNISK